MAYNSNAGRQSFTASLGQTDFSFNFKIFEGTDLEIYKTPSGQAANDTTDLLTIDIDYTVTIDGDNGGTITLLSGATLNDTIVALRVLQSTRTVSYVTNGDLLASTLNADQNYQTYLLADKETQQERSLHLPKSVVGVDTEIETPIPNAYQRWNASGTKLENDTTIPDAVVQSAANAAAALLSEQNAAVSEDNAAISAAAIGNMVNIDTIADLRLMTTTPANVYVTGYHTANDGAFGSHFFKKVTDTGQVDNGGTIIRTVNGVYELQFSGSVNIKWFGAVGDGISDNSETFALLSALNPNEVFFPDGIYLTSNRLELVGKVSASIYTNSAKIITTSKLSAPVNIKAQGLLNTIDCYHVNISGFTIEMYGDRSSIMDSEEKAILAYMNIVGDDSEKRQGDMIVIENNVISGSNAEAIYFSGRASNVIMRENTVRDSVGAVLNSNSSSECNSSIINNRVYDCYDGINATGSNVIVYGNIVDGIYNANGSGIGAGDTGANTTYNCTIKNNIIRNKYVSTGSLICGGIQLGVGIKENAIVSGNIIEDFAPIGINSTCGNCVIEDNIIKNLGELSNVVSYGISVDNGNDTTIVKDNILLSSGTKFIIGIRAGSLTSSTIPNMIVESNSITGTTAEAYGNADYMVIKSAIGTHTSATTALFFSNKISNVFNSGVVTLNNYDVWFTDITGSITSISPSFNGDKKTIVSNGGTTTIVNSSNLSTKDGLNVVLTNLKSITFVHFFGGRWREISRNV